MFVAAAIPPNKNCTSALRSNFYLSYEQCFVGKQCISVGYWEGFEACALLVFSHSSSCGPHRFCSKLTAFDCFVVLICCLVCSVQSCDLTNCRLRD